MGINFIKQYVGAGLGKDTTLLLPGFSADQDVINPVGAPMAGLFNTAHWSPDLTNPANQKFVAEFQKEYKRVPTLYASQGYDAALLIDAAVRDIRGKLEDREAVLQGAQGGEVRLGARAVQVQHATSTRSRTTTCARSASDGKGGLINKSFNEPILKDHGDAYVAELRDEVRRGSCAP